MAQKRATVAGPDREALEELGRRLAGVRLARNRTQAALAREAGVSTATVKRLEAGHSTQLANLVRVLRALGLAGNLEALAPPAEVRPIEALERAGRRRRRASPERAGEDRAAPARAWTWGDEHGEERR